MTKNLIINLISKLTHKQIKKKFESNPIYKPLEVKIDDVEFTASLIESCHYLHKSMIFLLERQDFETLEFTKKDLDNSRDYAAAIILQWYFTTWLKDVMEMHKLSGYEE